MPDYRKFLDKEQTALLVKGQLNGCIRKKIPDIQATIINIRGILNTYRPCNRFNSLAFTLGFSYTKPRKGLNF